jgi:hypothetical protein
MTPASREDSKDDIPSIIAFDLEKNLYRKSTNHDAILWIFKWLCFEEHPALPSVGMANHKA